MRLYARDGRRLKGPKIDQRAWSSDTTSPCVRCKHEFLQNTMTSCSDGDVCVSCLTLADVEAPAPGGALHGRGATL